MAKVKNLKDSNHFAYNMKGIRLIKKMKCEV